MKWREIHRFGLKKLPEPMLKDGFRSFAVTGEPVEAHLSVQRLVIVRQREPVDEGQVDEPHVSGAKFFQENFPKEEKVTASFTSGQAFNMAWRTLISKSLAPKESGAPRAVRRSSGVSGRSGAGGVIGACARVPKRGARAPRAVAEAAPSVTASSSRRGMV